MDNLIVTAVLLSPIAVNDDWTPHLDAVLEWLILDRHGKAIAAPTPEQIAATRPLVDQEMPLAKGELAGYPYWKVSCPRYRYHSEYQERYRKRWSPGIDSPPPRWGKRRANINTSAGAEKNYDLPLRVRTVDSIQWFCVGDRAPLVELLQSCKGLGKKRAQGFGQVQQWIVDTTDSDQHLYLGSQVQRFIPVAALKDKASDYTVAAARLMPPYWLSLERVPCACPTTTVVGI